VRVTRDHPKPWKKGMHGHLGNGGRSDVIGVVGIGNVSEWLML
jgi:hypothetical protein